MARSASEWGIPLDTLYIVIPQSRNRPSSNYTTQSSILADPSRPRSPFPLRNDRVEPIAVFHSRLGAFLVLGRCQKVVEDGAEHLGILIGSSSTRALSLLVARGFCLLLQTPQGKISTSIDDFLTGIEYWFFLDDATDYTICTDFSDWEPLPREDVPERWLAIDKIQDNQHRSKRRNYGVFVQQNR